MSSTYATFVNKDSNESINIIINGEPMVLSHNDCIQFNRYINLLDGEDNQTYSCTAKIIGFGHSGSPSEASALITRIFFLPWREKEGRWGPPTSYKRYIGLLSSWLGWHDIPEWTTIKKIPCPEQSAGKYNIRKSTKQTRRSRKRYSRK